MENTVKKPKKLDRRQIRTKRRIREALMALVMEKPVEKITIKELAERADPAGLRRPGPVPGDQRHHPGVLGLLPPDAGDGPVQILL